MQILEAVSYCVAILGLPIAIAVFVIQQRQQRQNEESALHRMLSEEYDNFLKLALDNADLLVFYEPSDSDAKQLSDEQKVRQTILYKILISLFEKAFIIIYDERMTRDTQRMWLSWEDDMREWCRRTDFRAALPAHLEGEDSEFSQHIRSIADEVGQAV